MSLLLALALLLPAPAAPARPAHFVPPAAPAPRAPAAPAGPTGVPGRAFAWPLDAPRVVRRFDPPPQPWRAGHRGVDLAAVPGAVVRSAGSGLVAFAGRIAGRGVVSVRHTGGLRTTYEPVDVEPTLLVGVPVTTGTPIGTLAGGHLGCGAAACLHWGLRRGTEYLDPLTLVGLGRVRLLPLTGSSTGGAGGPGRWVRVG